MAIFRPLHSIIMFVIEELFNLNVKIVDILHAILAIKIQSRIVRTRGLRQN